MTEHTFRTWDHEPLFYRAWRPEHAGPKAVLLFHRGHEHSGRLGDLAERLRLEDFSLFAWDQRGHGRSPGERGYAADFSTLIRDVDAFVRHVRDTYGIPVENMAIVAYSVGSVLASAWVHDYAPPIRALVLGAPAVRVKLYVPFALPLLRLKQEGEGERDVELDSERGRAEHQGPDGGRVVVHPGTGQDAADAIRDDRHILDGDAVRVADVTHEGVDIADEGREVRRVASLPGRPAVAALVPGEEREVLEPEPLGQVPEPARVLVPAVEQQDGLRTGVFGPPRPVKQGLVVPGPERVLGHREFAHGVPPFPSACGRSDEAGRRPFRRSRG